MSLVKLFVALMVSLVLMGVPSMADQVPESDVIVTPATRETPIPGENTIVTPATRDEPIEEQPVEQGDKSISFEGQVYNFPADTSDEEMLDFLNGIPAEEPIDEEELPEPLRERPIIKKDEGVRKNKEGQHVSYRDTEKKLTGGRGHLLTKEEKKLYPKGTVIADEVVAKWFEADMKEADKTLTELLEEKAVHVPDEVYDILLNMNFNMGKKSLNGFKEMWKAVEVADWATVAFEMLNTDGHKSKWFTQVGNRAIRLSDRMAALAPKVTEEEQVVTE